MGDFCRFFHIRTIPRLALNLPPLSKVRCCRPKKFGRLPEGLLYTHQPLHPHNHCKMTIIPCPAPSRLPPLSKGGGLTARHKLLLCCVLLATRPPLYSLNFYAVKTEGLLYTHQPLHPHNLLKRTSLALHHHPCHMNALLVSHPCETLGVQLRASMPVPCQR